MKGKAKRSNFFLSAMRDKCPNCGEGYVFVQETSFFHLPVMNESCERCRYQFEREPGYFLGAMYTSYGLAVLQGIVAFIICSVFFPSISTLWQSLIVLFVIVFFGRKNYKLSRIFYIHIFPW